MTNEEKKTLEKRLSSLDSNERNRLYKRAAQMRKLAQAKTNTRPRHAQLELEDDDRIDFRKPRPALLEWVLKVLSQDDAPSVGTIETALRVGTVVAIGPRSAEVVLDGKTLTCLLSKELAERQQSEIAVGDEVEVTMRGAETALIATVRPRRTKLSRPDPGNANQERVIVANVDVVAVVVSVVSPPLHPRLIDRYLIAIRRGGAEPVICVNKTDLLDEGALVEELKQLAPYERLGVPIVRCSASARNGLDELRIALEGKLAAFVGHSGVGKSSLLNAMKPELGLAVGTVSEGYGRGTHTTTRSTLLDLGGGTRIIDTPGIRSFGLWQLTAEELPWYFPEFAAVTGCKFRDCSHTHEPGCAVKEAVESGEVSRDRYETYIRILESL